MVKMVVTIIWVGVVRRVGGWGERRYWVVVVAACRS